MTCYHRGVGQSPKLDTIGRTVAVGPRALIGGAETVIAQKRIRIIKKIRESSGTWRFVSLHKIGNRYVWDKRPVSM